MFCIGSTQGGAFRLSITVKMNEAIATLWDNYGVEEIQQINFGDTVVDEQQVNYKVYIVFVAINSVFKSTRFYNGSSIH
jgi:hypothetical protein